MINSPVKLAFKSPLKGIIPVRCKPLWMTDSSSVSHTLLLQARSDSIVQAVRVEIERVCALLEEITFFCLDDQ